MNDSQRRRMDKIDREEAFFIENAADFTGNAKAQQYTDSINAEKTKILDFDAQQTSGFDDRRQAQEIYDARRDELIDSLEQIVLAAAVVDDDLEGTAVKFRNPYPRTDQNLIAKATSFIADAAPIQTELKNAGLPPEVLSGLPARRDAFQQAGIVRDAAEEKHAEATGGMADSFRKMMNYSEKRGKIVLLKYRNNPAKLAAFMVASHLDRAPRRPETPAAPPAA